VSNEETKSASEAPKYADMGGCFINESDYNYSVKRCRRAGHELQKLQLYKIHRDKLTPDNFIEE